MKQINNNFNEVFVIKRRRKLGLVLAVIGVIALVVLTSIYAVRQISGRGNAGTTVGGKTYYAVSMMQSTDILELQAEYNSAVTLGASGYIWTGDVNYLLALIYPEEKMANSVIATNSSARYRLQMVEIKVPKVTLELKDLGKEDKQFVLDCGEYLFGLADTIYELTIETQKQSLSVVACASSINAAKGELLAKQSVLNRLLSVSANNDIDRLSTATTKAANLLDKIVVDLLENTTDTISLKYGYCEYIRLLYEY